MTTQEELIELNDIITPPLTLRPNCSQHNPCGGKGYCRDNTNDEWTCVCKFWWYGTLCKEFSGSGKQVIALGVLLGVLIGTFYGIILFRSINKKRKLPKPDPTEKTRTVKGTFPPIPISTLHRSHRTLSWITGILTLIVATATLLIKWAIIKPIHEDIIKKFYNNQSLFIKPNPICRSIKLSAEFNVFTFPVACLLMLLFIFITKRVSFKRNKCCKGYIGIPIPLDFFAHVKRTLAAVIFAIFADELLDIVKEAVGRNGTSSNRGIIVSYLAQILKVFVIGFRRYPILAAVYIDNYFSLICATLYIWWDYSITIVNSGLCQSDFYKIEENYNGTSARTIVFLEYYGTGSKLIFLQLLNDIPRYLCLAYISVKLPILLVKHILRRKKTDPRLTREQKNLLYSSLPHSAESRYVKKLYGFIREEPATHRLTNIIQRIYTWRNDYRFSSRVICVYASLSLLLFFLTVEACVQVPPYLHIVREFFQIFVDEFASLAASSNPDLQKPDDPSADFPLPDLVRPFLLAVFTALIITILQLLVMLTNIRRNVLQAFRGDDSELPRRSSARNISYITGNFHFAGYLIGYVTVSYIILIFFALILFMSIDAFIVFGSVKVLESLLRRLIPALLFVFFKLFINKILGQHVFLQHSGEVLSINNRRAYMIFLYFNFFLDAFIGIFAAIIRLIKSAVGGVVYMCRLDYSPLGRKLETMDAGFSAYCGLIYMECAHRHPILLCFASHLLRGYLYPTERKRLSKAKHKWQLAVFLLNNPILIYRRKGFLTRVEQNDINKMLIGGYDPNDLYIQQPPILAHRASIISEKELEGLWERRKF